MISRFVLYFYYGFQAADLAGLGKELAPVGVKGTSGCHFGGERTVESGACPGSLLDPASVFSSCF
jgi:hypothetical protein